MVRPKIVFMFSGQGAQYFQMGQELFKEVPVFRSSMQWLDARVRELAGCSVIDTLYHDGHSKAKIFDRMLLTNPAIFMVEYALAQTLIEAGIHPDLTLGTSMGAFAAATVSGCIDVEDALQAVVNQAAVCEKYCPPGGMIAIFAAPALYEDEALRNHCTIASYNFSSHFVVAVKQDGFAPVEAFLREKNVNFQRVPVTFAFHSDGIDAAKIPGQRFFQSMLYKRAVIPMICCTQARILESLTEDYFWKAAREPIRFQETIAYLETRGNYRYIDLGPAGTLATFLKYGLPNTSRSTVATTLTPWGKDVKNINDMVSKMHREHRVDAA